MGLDFQRSTADNALNARKGYQASFHVEEAGRLLPGTFKYYSASADLRHYLPISDRVALLDQGRIRFVGTPDEFRASDDELVRAFIERDVPEDELAEVR